MCYECRMFGAGPFLCVKDRKVWKGFHHCPVCGDDGIKMGFKWRAPRLTNRRAWARIEAGDFLWDRSKHYVDTPTWSGDKLTLAKKKPIGFAQKYRRK